MLRRVLLSVGFVSLLVAVATISCSSNDEQDQLRYPLMQPDLLTYQSWYKIHDGLPEEKISLTQVQAESYPTSYSLVDYLDYDPQTRNQENCGDCWVWSGMAVLGIALNQQLSSNVRFSVQWFNSLASNSTIISDYSGSPYGLQGPCCGGVLALFAAIYNDVTTQAGYCMAIPWSNKNAEFQDGTAADCASSSVACCSNVDYQDISTDNAILFEPTLQANQIPIESTEEATIANMKNALVNNNRGVWFGMFLPNEEAWYGSEGFATFWDSQPVSTLWNPNSYCGSTYVSSGSNAGGGHAITIVGYYDDGTEENSYWEVLNSWGSSSGRPQGMFRLKMRGLNYNCTYETSAGTTPALLFETLSGVSNVSSGN